MSILRWQNIVAIKFLMVLSRNAICLYLITCLSLFWRSLLCVLRPLGLIMFCQRVIIAVITGSVHHTFALPASTGHSPNAVSMLFHCF